MNTKKFEEIYEKLVKDYSTSLEFQRKKVQKKYILIVGAGILLTLLILFITHSINIMPIIITLMLATYYGRRREYSLSFKNSIIKALIKAYDQGLNYEPQKRNRC